MRNEETIPKMTKAKVTKIKNIFKISNTLNSLDLKLERKLNLNRPKNCSTERYDYDFDYEFFHSQLPLKVQREDVLLTKVIINISSTVRYL